MTCSQCQRQPLQRRKKTSAMSTKLRQALAAAVTLLAWRTHTLNTASAFQLAPRCNGGVGRTFAGNSHKVAADADETLQQPQDASAIGQGDSPSPPLSDELPFFASWPVPLQNALRDHGAVRFVVNAATRTIAAPIFYLENPWCFPEFVRISGDEYPWLVQGFRSMGVIANDRSDVRFSKEAYGDHPSQEAQVMVAKDVDEAGDKSSPLFFFMHGGAWGSGFPTMYRLLSLPFLERNFRCIILGYRTYPDASVDGQVDDLAQAVEYFSEKYGGMGESGGPVVLMGHSSGAHVSMLAVMRGRLPAVDALIVGSGVYDVERQKQQEIRLGVSEISPLSAANGFTRENFCRNSPQLLVDDIPENFPPTLLVHGEDDEVTPLENSKDFYRILQDKSRGVDLGTSESVSGALARRTPFPKHVHQLEILEETGHQDVVTNTCLGKGRAQAAILDWIAAVGQ